MPNTPLIRAGQASSLAELMLLQNRFVTIGDKFESC
jgi:hypothetical protein